MAFGRRLDFCTNFVLLIFGLPAKLKIQSSVASFLERT
jgi:hypothetical protein